MLPNEPNTSSSGSNVTALWLSPDEWIIYANEKNSDDSNSYVIEEELINKISNTGLGAITDVTDQFVMLNLTGDKIYDLFMKGSPFNFNEFHKNNCLNSTYNRMYIIVDMINYNPDTFRIFALRSFGESLYHSITDSTLEFGYIGK